MILIITSFLGGFPSVRIEGYLFNSCFRQGIWFPNHSMSSSWLEHKGALQTSPLNPVLSYGLHFTPR